MGRVTARARVVRIRGDHSDHRADTLVVEEPLELRLDGTSLMVTMRTPGHDIDLVHGILLSENVIADPDEIETVRYCAGTDDEGRNTYNVIDVASRRNSHIVDLSLVARSSPTTSACGVCGKASIDALATKARWPLADDAHTVTPQSLSAMSQRLRESQSTFATTGGAHGAALFDSAGRLVFAREDIGRHNAVDKVIGAAMREGLLPLSGHTLLVSSRASFELAQKAIVAGIPILAAVSAPSSLAVEVAREYGLTLVGFLRGDSMNVYSAEHRVITVDDDPPA
ncbi:formate dehydrogenase accessory sulfurtransferase FdhD [Gordonia jinhuaensis]|uniref:Sulfur carrier protein FdhD n=1 Tax=Gordonia jinhuaensis TaxID=1517702 RepID=A0A916T3M7_9ACTN|nr:formate dehydrogenase accessory sulfurtransferase FdhD [Gordonia jinhuaensis]GGB30595.1 sulfurtransferase FdhD [Gordonia jinhuaensis]